MLNLIECAYCSHADICEDDFVCLACGLSLRAEIVDRIYYLREEVRLWNIRN
jgi:hypothetical protein